MHDCCGAIILELVGALAARAGAPWPGPWHTAAAALSQGPSCPVLRGQGPEMSTVAWGARALCHSWGWGGGREAESDARLHQISAPRLVVRDSGLCVPTCPRAGERAPDRPTCLYSQGMNKQTNSSSLAIILGPVCLSGCPRGTEGAWGAVESGWEEVEGVSRGCASFPSQIIPYPFLDESC